MILRGEKRQTPRTRPNASALVLALGYLLLLFPLLLHRHTAPTGTQSASTVSTQSVISLPHSEEAPVGTGDDCLLCNLLQLPALVVVALVIAFVLRPRAEFFATVVSPFHAAPRVTRRQPRAPPVFA